MKRFTLTFLLLCWHTIAIAAITMHINPTSAHPGETLRLTLTQDNATHFQGTPDLTPLKKDFTVVGTEHNMSYSAINGVATSESQWVVLLVAKKTGLITIPPIRIGQQDSNPGQVNIISRAIASADNNQNEPSDEDNAVTLHADVDQPNPFINQQIIYTVKLSTRQSLLNAQYLPPNVENALMIPLGDGRRYQTTLNGREYSVDEQRYAIYPQKSGELQITPPKLTAIIYDTVPNRINIEANETKLEVKPIPEKYANQQWIPAKQISITEQYDSSASTMNEGSTLVRTITLRANGLPAELLPNLTFADNEADKDQFSVYPEKPETHNALRQQELIGTSTTKVTYILNQVGNITLPSLELSWFNTQTGQHEITALPSRSITVTSPSGSSTTAPSPPPIIAEQPHPINTIQTPQLPVPAVNQPKTIAWWIAGAFATAWMLTLSLWWMKRRHENITKPNLRKALNNIRRACEKNDQILAHTALLNWGKLKWPDVTLFNLSDLNALIDNALLNKQILLLSEALYSQKAHSAWQGKTLWHAVKNYRPCKAKKKNKTRGLPPMNPC